MNLIAIYSPECIVNFAMKSLHDNLEDTPYTHTMKLLIEGKAANVT